MATEFKMGSDVQHARDTLCALLTRQECRTIRTPGSENPRTFEDQAREISESDDARAKVIGAALHVFQAAVNTFWEYAWENELPHRGTKTWMKRRRIESDLAEEILEEGVSEATMAVRYAIVRFDPTRNVVLNTYCNRTIHHALDLWFQRRQAVVELPQNVARDGVPPPEQFDTYYEEVLEAKARGYRGHGDDEEYDYD